MTVAFHAPGEDGEQVAVVREGDDVGAALDSQSTGDGAGGRHRHVRERGWKAGAYEAVLASGDGTELARYPFWIQDAGVDARSRRDAHVREGEPIDISWQAAPGNRWDWSATIAAAPIPTWPTT